MLPDPDFEEDLEWVDCYGGPADGERVPIDLSDDPMTEFPYLLPNKEVYWYQLNRSSNGQHLFVLAGMTTRPGWHPFSTG